MGDLNHEPSMEEILASIKRIIAEDGEGAPVQPRRGRRATTIPGADPMDAPSHEAVEEGVLELTERVDKPVAKQAAASGPLVVEEEAVSPADQPAAAEAVPPLVSQPAERASRDAIAALSSLVVKPEAPGSDSLEGMVREMLRPMLKQWLDSRLPDVVEQIVQREIARIVGNR